MSKKSLARLTGFLGAVGVTAALAGFAVAGTGAYFTDTKAGNLNATSGHLTLNVSDTYLSMSDLMPGGDKTQNIDYNVDSSGKADVWIVFDPTTPGFGAFTGAKGSPVWPDGGLGNYGHFAVSNNGGGTLFTSYNLAGVPATESSAPCAVDVNGAGGSTARISSPSARVPYCPVPTAIRVATGLVTGQGGTINLTFGLTGKVTTQNMTWANVPFKVVATQENVRPDALNF